MLAPISTIPPKVLANWEQSIMRYGIPKNVAFVEFKNGKTYCMRGEAVCQIFRQGTIERVFGDLTGRWGDIDARLEIQLPDGIVPESESLDVAAVALAEALKLDVDGLVEKRLADNYGDDWRDEVESWDSDDRAYRLEDYRITAIRSIANIWRDGSGEYSCR